jgi:calcium/calmodulin-dependent protein kinase (CaM kinase) II
MIEEAVIQAMGFSAEQRELLVTTWLMLDAIHQGDSETYAALCAPDLTCFEDVCPYRIDGVEFHLSLIRLMARDPANRPARFDILNPQVQLYGDTGIVTYTRLMTYDDNGRPRWTTFNETRVYVRINGAWKMAHFHRSPAPA